MTDITPMASTVLQDFALQSSAPDPNANDLDKDAFLQLLVAQLRYQDPLNPNDPAEFMATTAQFTVVEKLDELTQQGANTAIISGLSMASSLVGREVTYVGADDVLATGLVSSAQVNNGEVSLVTDQGVVDLSTVIGIGAAAGVGIPIADVPEPSDRTDEPAPVTADAPIADGLTTSGSPAAPTVTPAPAQDVADSPAAPIIIPTLPNLPDNPISIPASLFPTRPDGPTTPAAVASTAASSTSTPTTASTNQTKELSS